MFILAERTEFMETAHMIGTKADCLRFVLAKGLRRKLWYLFPVR